LFPSLSSSSSAALGSPVSDFALPSSKADLVSLLSFFDPHDFRARFFGVSLSVGGVDFTFSLILVDRLGVSPVPQSNSEMTGLPGCAFRYCSNYFLVLISSPGW